jgi:membrane protein
LNFKEPKVEQLIDTGNLLRISLLNLLRSGGMRRAGALTYTTILALVPLLVLIFTLFKMMGGLENMQQLVEPHIFRLLTPGTGEQVRGFITGMVESASSRSFGLVGTLFLFVMSYGLLSSIENDFNLIWGERKNRSLTQRVVVYWTLLTLAPLLLGVSIYLSTRALTLSVVQLTPELESRLAMLLPALLQMFAFWLLFWIMPKTRVRLSAAFWAALVTSLLWELAKWGFASYSASVIQYNLIYGSLAVFPLFLIWLFVTWIVVLFGAELCFVIQNRQVVLFNWKQKGAQEMPRHYIAVSLMRIVTRAFTEGHSKRSPEHLARQLEIDTGTVNNVINVLQEGGLLQFTDSGRNPAVVLARAPEQISLYDVIALFMLMEVPQTAFEKYPESTDLFDIINNSSGDLRQTWSNITMKDITHERK